MIVWIKIQIQYLLKKYSAWTPCAAHTSRTLQPTRRPRGSTKSTGVILNHLLKRGVSQGGVTLSLTSHPSLSFRLSCLLVSPLAYLCQLRRHRRRPPPPPLFVVWPPLPAWFVGIYIEISRRGGERKREKYKGRRCHTHTRGVWALHAQSHMYPTADGDTRCHRWCA